MIATLISGKLTSTPELRQTTDGRTITIASIKARAGRDTTEVWQAQAHDRVAQVALMKCTAGDVVSLRGVPTTRTARIGGEAVIQRILYAETVLPLRSGEATDARL